MLHRSNVLITCPLWVAMVKIKMQGGSDDRDTEWSMLRRVRREGKAMLGMRKARNVTLRT